MAKVLRMKERNIGFLIFGAILMIIGLVASFYKETHDIGDQVVTPYQIVGIILVVAALVLIAFGLLYSSRMGMRRSTAHPQPESIQSPKREA